MKDYQVLTQRLREYLREFTTFDLQIEYQESENTISVSTTHYGIVLQHNIDPSLIAIDKLSTSEKYWKNFLKQFDDASARLSIKLLTTQFDMIERAYELVFKKYWQVFSKPADISNPIDPDLLDAMCTQLFVNRLGENCRAASKLAGGDIKSFEAHEMPIGIIIRSCILDCLEFTCWAIEPEYINKIAAESFSKLPRNTDPLIVSRYKAIATFLNHKAVSFQRDKILKKTTYIATANDLYMYYSKYDHFSLIPLFLDKTIGNKLGMAVKALEHIRLCFFSIVDFSENIPPSEFSDLLGITSDYNESTKSYKLDATPLNTLLKRS